jgi:hypothetical protein
MELRHSDRSGRVRWLALCVLAYVAVVAGCEREDPPPVDRNRPPETFITQGPDNSADPQDPVNLFYRAHLYWRGEDDDGRVVGFRLAVDDTADAAAWAFTTSTDSVFRFPVAEIGPLEHLFLIRAVDNLGKQDPTPDTLRFEAFTSAPPTVRLVDICAQQPTLGLKCGMAINDTAEVFSDFTWTWTGGDADGEIVRWRSQFDTDPPVEHARLNTTRTVLGLPNGPHTLTVIAIDDAGAVSRDPGRFKVISNYDPETVIDRSSIVATLERPWIGPDSTLVVDDIVGDPHAPPDTVPFNSHISMCWSATDKDGDDVTLFQYVFTSAVQGQTPDTCASPTGTLTIGSHLGSVGGVFLVKGRDEHGRFETHADTLSLFVNFRPTVGWLDEGVQERQLGLQYFEFDGTDKDSDPRTLEFEWGIDNEEQPEIEWTPLPPGNRRVDYFFTTRDLGFRTIVIRSRDDVAELESAPDTLIVNVVQPAGSAAR